MKRTLLALALIAATAAPLSAQTDGDKLVARVNGEEITNRNVDALWNRLSADMQARYMKSGGGKLGFLQNQIAKKLLVQEAIRSGYAAKAGAPLDLDPVAEGLLFDGYVKDVIAGPLISEADMLKVYEENKSEFMAPEQGWIRIIRREKKDNPEAAREAISKVMVEIFSARTVLAQTYSAEHLTSALSAKFAEVAGRVSDHPTAAEGGDMGFVALHTVDPKIADAVRTMKPGSISGILETQDAYQMILVHEHRPAGVENYETAKGAIRGYLMAREPKRFMDAVAKKSSELRAAGKVEIFRENLR